MTKPVLPPEYFATLDAMVEAGREWIEAHPRAQPKFQPLGFSANVGVIADLDGAMILRVSANESARAFLHALDAAAIVAPGGTGGGATIMLAEVVIERLFGKQRALTVPAHGRNR